MPPTPQAVIFVLSELWSPAETEAFICHFWPPGVAPGNLRALLSTPPLDLVPYMDHLIDIATDLIMAGHQRSLVQILQERGALHIASPLPPIEVRPRFFLLATLAIYF
jgi:hypothetical protein